MNADKKEKDFAVMAIAEDRKCKKFQIASFALTSFRPKNNCEKDSKIIFLKFTKMNNCD